MSWIVIAAIVLVAIVLFAAFLVILGAYGETPRTKKSSRIFAGGLTASPEEYSSLEYELEGSFEKVRAGSMLVEDYRDQLLEARRTIAELKNDIRDVREHEGMDSEEYSEWREIVSDEVEAVRWRLEWAEKELLKRNVPADERFADQGKWAAFDYSGTDGNTTSRRIRNWSKENRYIVGYCDAGKAQKTFRQDRIANWRSG